MFEERSDQEIGIIRRFHAGIIFRKIGRSDVCVGGIEVRKKLADFTSGKADIW